MIYIGIDPGLHTGWAEWYKEDRKLDNLMTIDFWRCVDRLKMFLKLHTKFHVVIEDPNLNKPLFSKNSTSKGLLRIAQNVGSNKREASLLIEFMEKENISYTSIKPTTSKWNVGTFKNFTKYKERTSEHSRDAAKLIFDR